MPPRAWKTLLSFCCPGLGHYCADQPTAGAYWMMSVCGAYVLAGPWGLLLHAACVASALLEKPAMGEEGLRLDR